MSNSPLQMFQGQVRRVGGGWWGTLNGRNQWWWYHILQMAGYLLSFTQGPAGAIQASLGTRKACADEF